MKLLAKWIYFAFVVTASFLMAFKLSGFNWQQITTILFFVVGSFFMFWALFIADFDDIFMKKENKDDQEQKG